MKIDISPAAVDDVATLLRFIRGLAEYEKLSEHCHATEESLRSTLFGGQKVVEVLIARLDDEPVGYALFFHNYSTFQAKLGIYLEDIFVLPECRGKGVGKALLQHVVQLAYERGCGRVEWSVLDWNQPAIDFYERFGATVMPDWRIVRMTREQMRRRVED